MLIEDANNAMLIDYAKNIGLAMRGIKVSICEKWNCKKINIG